MQKSVFCASLVRVFEKVEVSKGRDKPPFTTGNCLLHFGESGHRAPDTYALCSNSRPFLEACPGSAVVNRPGPCHGNTRADTRPHTTHRRLFSIFYQPPWNCLESQKFLTTFWVHPPVHCHRDTHFFCL